MSRIEQLPKMWQRPGMYLFDYYHSDGASMLAEFIHTTYYLSGTNRPSKVRFQSHGEMYTCIAEGVEIKLDEIGSTHLPLALEEDSCPIDWLSSQAVTHAANSSLQLSIGIANLISFTEFCVLDMIIAGEHFRQMFYLGKPVSPYVSRQKSELPTPPYLSLWFTLHPTVFQSRTIRAKRVKEALERLKTYVPVEFQVTEKKRFDGFEMTIDVAQKAAEPKTPTAAYNSVAMAIGQS
jgi:hypothetical protein